MNGWLRLTERPHIARASPARLRSSIEARAKIMFRPPGGTVISRMTSAGPSVSGLVITGPGAQGPKHIFYVHGGAFIFGSPQVYRGLLGRLSQLTGCPAWAPDYRKAPEHPFPAAPQDVRAAWDGLIANGVNPAEVVVGGDSAGGGLALSLLGSLLADGASLPAGVFAFSPVTDLTFGGASIRDNAKSDVILPAERARELTGLYLDGHDATDPRVSPLFADFRGAPPVLLMVSDSEILLDDTKRMAKRLQDHGVDVQVIQEHDLPHVWPLFRPWISEADQTLRDLSDWIRRVLAR